MQARFGRFYPWFVVGILILLYTSNFIDRSIFGLLVKPIRADLQISDTQYSLLAGFSFAVMYALGGIPMGWVADHYSRRMMISIGCFVWSLMTALCGVMNTFSGLFVARVGVGIGEATLSPGVYSLMPDYFPPNKLARAMSFYSMAIPLGAGLALIIGGSVVDWLEAQGEITLPFVGTPRPWQMVFFVIGIPGLLLALLTPLLVAEPPRSNYGSDEIAVTSPGIPATLRFLWERKGIYGSIIMGVTLAALCCYAANTWLPSVLQRVHGYTAGEAGKFLGFSILFLGVPGAISAGFATDFLLARGRADAHMIVGRIWVTGILVCSGIGPLVPVPWLSLTLIAALGFFSFTWTGVPTSLLQTITPNRMRGQMTGIYLLTVTLVGLGIGPTAVGVATDYVFRRDDAVGQSLGLVCVVAGILSLLCLRTGLILLTRANLLPRVEQPATA